jgi:Kef-type K+ transport system membrane component KefB
MHTGTIPELDSKGLRSFGLTTGAIVAGLFGLLLPWIFGYAWPLWPWIVMAVLCLWAIIHPVSLRLVYTPWMRFGLVMSKITTPILMSLMFFLIAVPVSLVFRLLRYDPLRRRYSPVSSYRENSERSPSNRLERPF